MERFHKDAVAHHDNVASSRATSENIHLGANAQTEDVSKENMQTSEESHGASSVVFIEECIVKIEEIDNKLSASSCNTEPERKIEVMREGEASTTVYNTFLLRRFRF